MWLLDTQTVSLTKFLSPEAVYESTTGEDNFKSGYAILSHCWGEEEQNFQETLKLQDNPVKYKPSEKIKQFCSIASQLGYKWGWADTCCIDKTSSSDLSEAIRSMFRYYSLSAVCIVFLHDVPTGSNLRGKDSAFRTSRWHKRGWTLQELIAPKKKVVFYSQDWKELTTRAEEAPLLEEITGIPEDVLMGKKDVTKISVAARMSWAAQRATTRMEDEAYCLLGILKVDMYTSYGEGRHAFYRLQEEILKNYTDTSIFAWGKVGNLADLKHRPLEPLATCHDHKAESFLFAPSPAAFANSSSVNWMPNIFLGSTQCAFDISSFLTLQITPYGICGRFPVTEFKEQGLLVAFIACSKGGHRVGLILRICDNADATSPSGPIYDVGFISSGAVEGPTKRLALLTLERGNAEDQRCFEWREMYIRMRPSSGEDITPAEKEGEETPGSQEGWGKRLLHYMVMALVLIQTLVSLCTYKFMSVLYVGNRKRASP